MKKLLVVLLFSLATALSQTPAIDLALTVTDGAGAGKELRFGIDGTATDAIDLSLGEVELPPPPPAGIFDARFSGANIGVVMGQGTLRDYRKGEMSVGGTSLHEIRYQVGGGTSITISWDLPAGVSGLLQDFLGGIAVNRVMNGSGSVTVTNPNAITSLKMTIVYENSAMGVGLDRGPFGFQLWQNYPNPFNPETEICFSISSQGMARLVIYDAKGSVVSTLFDQPALPGTHYRLRFSAGNKSSGVYFCRLESGSQTKTVKMLLTR
jgi:hypothetical protein